MYTKIKQLSKSGLIVMVMVGGLVAPSLVWPTASVSADHCYKNEFLTLPHWYRGLADNNHGAGKDCAIGINGLGDIWVIVLNITDILLQVVGYIAAGFVLYGGIRYIISNGSPDDIAKAKDTIMKALIGMVLAMSAAAIVGFIVGNMG